MSLGLLRSVTAVKRALPPRSLHVRDVEPTVPRTTGEWISRRFTRSASASI